MVVLEAVNGAAAGLGFVGLVLLVGVPVCCVLLWPSARQDTWVRRLIVAGYGLTAIPALVSLGVLALEGDGLLPALASLSGAALAARVVLATAVFWVTVEDDHAAGVRPSASVLALGAPLLLTWMAEGGALTGEWIPVKAAASVLHLLAVAIWLGGLVVLTTAFLPMSDTKHLAVVIPRFSPVAALAVATLAATGVIHALAAAGSVRVLATSTYGAILAIKLLLFAGVLLLGNQGRRYAAHRIHVSPPRSTVQVLCLCLGAELALATVILGITAVLPSARDALPG
jgi:copper transport protein